MIHISILQLLRLWSELDDAYYEKNGFGGDTAEIYAYTLLPAHPSADSDAPERMRNKSKEEDGFQAAKTLLEILNLFAKMRKCVIVVDGRRLGRWFLQEPFDYKVHIMIKKKG